MPQTLKYTVTGMTCSHCKTAITSELLTTPGVDHVDVDLATKSVVVLGEALDDAALRAAIVEAGYEAS